MKLQPHSTFLLVVTLIMVSTIFLVARQQNATLNQAKQNWETQHNQIETQFIYLTRLKEAMGYGGFIHHFKNYILRQDIIYLRNAKSEMETFKDTLDDFKNLEISNEKRQALDTIEKTFSVYEQKIGTAEQLITEGRPIVDIDSAVKVDDYPALNALGFLEKAIEQDYKNTTEALTALINRISFQVSYYLPAIITLFWAVTVLTVGYITYLKERIHQKSDRLKSDFLATMSHEIRTPMNGVLGMSELIMAESKDKKIKNYAATIMNSGESLLHIIDDILDFSKIDAGKLELDPQPVDLTYLVDGVASLHNIKAREKAIEIAVHFKEGTEQFVYVDPVRMRQILSNLLSNAIKFTEKGSITITVEEQSEADYPEKYAPLLFTVTDTGIGLSEKEQNRIFEKFSQADSSTTRNYGGTGLGLSICKSLVELMDGTIGVQSKKNQGTSFWFTLPLPRNTDKPQKRPEVSALEGVKILVVDDLQVIQDIAYEELSAFGMRCDTCASGPEALELLQQAQKQNDPYDIIIIDYLMPGMDGEALAAHIKEDLQIKDLCIVMLTAAGTPQANEQFIHKGFFACLLKPMRKYELIENIHNIWNEYRENPKRETLYMNYSAYPFVENQENEDALSLPDKHILIAEDNFVNQAFIQEIIETMDAKCTVTVNGKAALDALKNAEFDLVLMDCLMPVMDGFEATRQIRRLQHTGAIKQDLRVVALTANAMKGDKERCLAAGMDDYLAKPVRKKDLKEMIYRMIVGTLHTESGNGKEAKPKSRKPFRNKKNEREKHKEHSPDNTQLDEIAVQHAKEIFKDRYENMVTLYIENSWDRIVEIDEALEEEDLDVVIRSSHTLKSTSKQMGAIELAEIAQHIEEKAKQTRKNQQDPTSTLTQIANDLPRAKESLKKTDQAFKKTAS